MPHHHGATGSWEVSLPMTVVLLLMALVYLRSWIHLRSTVMTFSAWRAASFLLGLFLIWVAVASPLAALDHELLTVHMIQHLLLMTLAPPLIWLGEPVLAFSRELPQRFVHAIEPVFHRRLVQYAGRIAVQPKFALLAASAALVGWHIPGAFALAMQSNGWHMVAHTSFLVTGLLFWWPVIQPWPSVARSELSIILYLFFATLPCDILSGFLVFCDRVVYPSYLSSSHLFGFSALGDQQCAAALMWTCVTMMYLVAGAILTMRMLSPQEAETRVGAATNFSGHRVEAV